MGELQSGLKVLMLPWLAHGHISPFLELAKKLTKRNMFIYLCSTPVNLISAARKLTPPYSESIKLVEIHLPNLPNLPPHYHTTNGLPPHLMDTLKEAFHMSKPDLFNILVSLKPDFVIYDTIAAAGDVAWSAGIPAIDLLTFGATFISYFMNFAYHKGREFPFPEIYLLEYEKTTIVPMLNAHKSDNFDRVDPSRSCNLRLIKSSREVEGKYIDYLTSISNKEIIPIGILVDLEPVEDDNDDSLGLLQWLDTKEKRSTVFVSFGSELFLTNNEIEEIAFGLESSNVNFIWVIRIPKEKDKNINLKDHILPKGFLARVGERGRIVEGWAPQAKILRHSSIGGFMSHCGWSSVLESMTFGVPIVAMPMQIDQPLNARLVAEVGVGLEVARDENGKVERESVAKTVREVVAEAGGDGVRRRAKEISAELLAKGEEEIDVLAKKLVEISQEMKKTV